jgi:hypothetical protein
MASNRLLVAGAGLSALIAAAAYAPSAAGAATATTTTTAAATTTTGARPTTGKALVAAMTQAADTQTSVRYVTNSTLGGRSVEITASAGTTVGTQVIVLREGKNTGRVDARLVNKIVYFRGNTFGLEEYLGMPATLAPKYSGKWIFFSPATKDYSGIEKSMTLSAAISEISISGPFTTTAATVDGQATKKVKGTTTSLSSKGKKGTAIIYLKATGVPLPVRYQATGKQKNQNETGTVVFSDWGVKVHPATPHTSIPASSISSSA